jgi:hypothetical protein
LVSGRALGLEADNPDAYGEGVLFETIADWGPRASPISATQQDCGISVIDNLSRL